MDDDVATGTGATGDSRVDEALRSLRRLSELPTSEHPTVFERVHGQLVEVLGELGSGADQAGGQPR